MSTDGMNLYDDARSEYARLVVDHFKAMVEGLPASGGSEEMLRQRYNLLRSVDVMSYTVGVQPYYESLAPVPYGLEGCADAPAAYGGTAKACGAEGIPKWFAAVELGEAIWSGTVYPHDPQAHEVLVMERVLSKLQPAPGASGLRGIDIGAGYGGWARLLALSHPEVTQIGAIEYQEHIRQLAERFTAWNFAPATAAGRVAEIDFWRDRATAADARPVHDVNAWLAEGEAHERIDFAFAFLSLLHIGETLADKQELLRKIAGRTRAGGRLYFEDIVLLPQALERPEWHAKAARVMWMNAPTTHLNYSRMLAEAGYRPLASAPPYKMLAKSTTYDASSAWSDFTRARSLSFRELTPQSKLCLEDDGRVVSEAQMQSPARAADGSMLGSCVSLRELLGEGLVAQYLRSQRQFFTEVCETFNGKGELRKDKTKTCGNDAMLGYDVPEGADAYDGPADHPPLCGGILALAEIPAETPAPAAIPAAAAPDCERRQLAEAAASESETLWHSEWQRRIECWWLGSPRREEVRACWGALTIHLADRFERLLRRSEAGPAAVAEPGCDWISKDGELGLPEWPEVGGFEFSVPAIPRIVPSLERLQTLVGGEAPAPPQQHRQAQATVSFLAGAVGGLSVGSLLVWAFLRRRERVEVQRTKARPVLSS